MARFPWVTASLVASCLLVSLPLYFDPHRFYLTLGVSFCDAEGPVHWWHAIVSRFVHGRGVDCGFPPLTFHLAVNCALFIFHGMLAERLLGSGRIALLTFSCLALQIVLMLVLIDGRGHGASGMTWSYVPFAIEWLRHHRARLRRDPFGLIVAALVVFAIAGLVKHWHLWNLLLSLPFWFVWRKTLRANLAGTQPEDRGTQLPGIAAGVGVVFFNAFFVVQVLRGAIQPMSVECADLENGRVPCVIDFSRHDAATASFDVRLQCANGNSTTESRAEAMEAGAKRTVHISAAHCDRVVNGGIKQLRVERR